MAIWAAMLRKTGLVRGVKEQVFIQLSIVNNNLDTQAYHHVMGDFIMP